MKVTYVMDPQCGWCYGNSENITALQKEFEEEFDFELLVGGMWLGKNTHTSAAQSLPTSRN